MRRFIGAWMDSRASNLPDRTPDEIEREVARMIANWDQSQELDFDIAKRVVRYIRASSAESASQSRNDSEVS